MNLNNTNRLYQDFPNIFANKLPNGFEFNDGWYAITYALCKELDGLLKKSTQNESIAALQCKEKFGTLNFYVSVAPSAAKLSEDVHAIISKYEKLSRTTCEETGGLGSLCKRGSVVQTLCPASAILLGFTPCHEI